ncbi:hypothetical protein HK105_203078 [Polyrhizophydium stewartii]|uniref:Choline/carnitine acyltransferase domain-containing protein n=1 Tax=Polyrhizophydium stewartii TaxID=2732419 RepID=A0ABR4NCZ7_9FUNG
MTRVREILEAVKRFALIRQQLMYLMLILPDSISSQPRRLLSQMEDISDKLYNEESLHPLDALGEVLANELFLLKHIILASVAIQDHVFQDAVVNAYVGQEYFSRWRSAMRNTMKNGRAPKSGTLMHTFQALFRWLSLKIGLYFYNVIHPRQIANVLANGRRVHFPDDVEPEYLLPILEYHKLAHPMNVSLIYVVPNNLAFSDGYAFHSSAADAKPPSGVRRFPAILSYPEDPPLDHWPNIISILQSHNRFFKQRVRNAAETPRQSAMFLSFLSSIWSSATGAGRRSSLSDAAPRQDDEFLGGGHSITFHDAKLNVTYFLCRLDTQVFLSVIHQGEGSGWTDMTVLLADRLMGVVQPTFE